MPFERVFKLVLINKESNRTCDEFTDLWGCNRGKRLHVSSAGKGATYYLVSRIYSLPVCLIVRR